MSRKIANYLYMVSTGGCNRGADRQTDSELKLYLTNIQNDDAGEYECRGRVEGNDVKKNSKLLIYGEYRGVQTVTEVKL